MDPAMIASALSVLAPVITATVEALTRGGDWRAAAREALDSAEAADHGLAGPRADAIEARHRERLAAAPPVSPGDAAALEMHARLPGVSLEAQGALLRAAEVVRWRGGAP